MPSVGRLTQQELEAHLWGAAKILRGKTAGQDYKNYILSLMFFKRLCDQWEQEAEDAIIELEKQQGKPLTQKQRGIFRARGEHRFTIPSGSRWSDVIEASTNLGEVLTKAMRAVADANDELRGVFTVDWNQPAPDGSGKPLIPNEVVHALLQHFDEEELSNKSVSPDVLGRAYEFLIKQFADDAGAKAGEFFTPPAVVDLLVRMLEPRPRDTVYDPTGGSGGMLVHSADFLRAEGHHATAARYFAQEMNWSNAAIAKINSVLHGLEAEIKGGASTITDPQFLDDDGSVKKFSLVLANFPFSDDLWWLRPGQQTDDKKRKAKLKNEIFGKEGYKDAFGRFGRGSSFPAPPANYGDYAFILHILASLTNDGRAGIVCPQGVLFRGQPATVNDTGELDGEANPKLRQRKADDEYLIRRSLLEADVIEAIVSLPPNIFYGAGVPACLVILRKKKAAANRGQVLLVYAARHYRELSAKNELRPQDVMRILVHYRAYGDASKVPGFIAKYDMHIRQLIDRTEEEEIARLMAEYDPLPETLTQLKKRIGEMGGGAQLEKQVAGVVAKLEQRDEQIAEVRLRAEEDRQDVAIVGEELTSLYSDSGELAKHARVVDLEEIMDNEFNLNIPRFVDTFDPEPVIGVKEATEELEAALRASRDAESDLWKLLNEFRYEN